MKILLVAVDAKFIHTNLAVHSLKAYAKDYKDHIQIAQYSINHSVEEILRGVYLQKADVVAFSCYIWNISMILRVIEGLKKVESKVKIWCGGPEVSYYPLDYLKEHKELDGILVGEGEQTFYELTGYYLGVGSALEHIKGIVFKDSARLNDYKDTEKDKGLITTTSPREFISLDDIPFAYEDIDSHKNKIIYYESSRGCPYSCSYCLSSAQRGVRFRNLELVKRELKIFLDYKVPQVKFVDRTFNCNKEHAMAIWRFIKDEDNGVTNFHFEITADLITDQELELLESLRPGLVQLEIGVQTTNPNTMKAIQRKVNFEKLSNNVERIKRAQNIHQHLDLIAGLPLEDYTSFEKSFYDVYKLRPDQLQLGFLKVLKGSIIEEECKNYGIVYNNEPPYEVLFTNHLTYDEVIELKGICDMVEVYYNSGQFAYSMEYMEHFFETPMKLYKFLYNYYNKMGLYTLAHSRMRRYEILLDFFVETVMIQNQSNKESEIKDVSEDINIFKEILLYDLCLREALKNRPDYVGNPVSYAKHREICDKERVTKSKVHIEQFTYDIIETAKAGKGIKRNSIILFDYGSRDPITNSAITRCIY